MNFGTFSVKIVDSKVSNYTSYNYGEVLTFNFKKGSTWEEWISSIYNTEQGKIEYDMVWLCSSPVSITYNLDDFSNSKVSPLQVSPEDRIEDGHMYGTHWQGAECVFPKSNILTSIEGTTKLAEQMKEGDSIAYYDFEQNQVEIGKVNKVYIHPKATSFVKYKFEDGTYLEATSYHPIYTKQGWKSLTKRNEYKAPEIGDEIKTEKGWKKLISIKKFTGVEDCYDFAIETMDGKIINNYFANGTLVQGSY